MINLQSIAYRSVYDLKCDKIVPQMLAEYNQELSTQFAEARGRIETIMAKRQARALPAIVLDIDETCLVNLMYVFNDSEIFTIYDREYNAREYVGAFSFENGLNPIVPAFREFYEFLIRANVRIYYLTGRTSQWMVNTKKNLHILGIDQYEDLFFNTGGEPATTFKANKRKFIRDIGYDLIFAMGDQESDVYGGPADVKQDGMVLYNPFYTLIDPAKHVNIHQ